MAWNKLHGKILQSFFKEMDKANIQFFIIRNYEGLPEFNASKDVDVILKHGTAFKAELILKQIFKIYGLNYYYRVRIEECFVCRAINTNGNFSIHIDLMNGYINRGIELFSFEELYNQTKIYKSFRVLNDLYTGIMLFIYKQFGYKKPYLKREYQEKIYATWMEYPEFSNILSQMLGEKLFGKVEQCIKGYDFNKVLSYSKNINIKLRKFSNKQHFLKNTYRKTLFIWQKVNRIIFRYRKYEKSISVIAPDGTGKTTFLKSLLKKLAFLYVDSPNDLGRFHIYHFRPTLLPNLGQVGEKAKLMRQDKNFTAPHRAKPAGFLSSLFRITYYWIDYVIGWMYMTRKDVQYDRYSIYDRYSYDLIADPWRTRLNLPLWIRKFYVKYMPHPKICFLLMASPTIIIKRKAELTLKEIILQQSLYKELSKKCSNIIPINANNNIDSMVNSAVIYIIKKYWSKL